MFKCLIALTSLLSATALAVPVWTWVDESGQRHYSDRPVEGATQIEVNASQTFTPARADPPQSRSSQTPDEAAYSVLDIIRPTSDETLVNTGGSVTLELATYPALRPNHTIDVILNGQSLQANSRTLVITLTDVFRGEHTVQAVIRDAAGTELLRSEPVTFFVRQNSVQSPAPAGGAPRPSLVRPPPPPPGAPPGAGGN